MRSPQQRRSTTKVRAVLDAARQLADRPDAAPLTTRLLAERAGVPVATLYRYFADVDEVLDVLVAEHADATAAALGAVFDGPAAATVGEAFDRAVDALLDLYAERPELARRWANPQLADRQRAIDLRTDHALADRLAEHVVAAGLLPGPAEALAPTLRVQWDAAGVVLGAVLAAEPPQRPALEAELRALVAHFASRHDATGPA